MRSSAVLAWLRFTKAMNTQDVVALKPPRIEWQPLGAELLRSVGVVNTPGKGQAPEIDPSASLLRDGYEKVTRMSFLLQGALTYAVVMPQLSRSMIREFITIAESAELGMSLRSHFLAFHLLMSRSFLSRLSVLSPPLVSSFLLSCFLPLSLVTSPVP